MKLVFAIISISLAVQMPRASEHQERPTNAPACIELRDQYDAAHKLSFPTTNVTLLAIADQKGSDQVDAWIAALKPRYASRIELRGLADVGGVPGFLRGKVRKRFRETRTYPVMMDWSGKVCAQFGFQPGQANVLVIARDGNIQARVVGTAREPALEELSAAIDAAMSKSASVQSNSTPRPTAFRQP